MVHKYLPKCIVYEAEVTTTDKRVLYYGIQMESSKLGLTTNNQSHSQAPAHALLKIHMQYITHLKYCVVCLFICL